LFAEVNVICCTAFLDDLSTRVSRWLACYSLAVLRISLGLVFVGFGLLKFIPGLSPAEDLVSETIEVLTLGLIPDGPGLLLVATLETAVGLLLLTGRFLRVGLGMLALVIVGTLSPLVLFPDRLFAGPAHAPTLEGQYVLKDVVLLAAGLVLASSARD
jgi:putative oxidoreductase